MNGAWFTWEPSRADSSLKGAKQMACTRRWAFLMGCLFFLAASSEGNPQDKPTVPPLSRGGQEAPKPGTGQQSKPGKVEVRELPPVKTDNKNTLIRQHRPNLTLAASSFWPGWPTGHAFDGNLETSWFTARDDSAAKGKKPWLQVTFPADVTVNRVTILGNRDPAWLNGYTILAGSLELLDKENKRLKYEENEGTGNFRDFDFRFARPIPGVRAVRFTSLGDQGDQNPYGDIAIAEFQVE